jgi:hypothetical protein
MNTAQPGSSAPATPETDVAESNRNAEPTPALGSNDAVQRTAGGKSAPELIYRGTTSHTRARRQPAVDLPLVDTPAGPETPSPCSDSVRATARNRAPR